MLELQDIFNKYSDTYKRKHKLPSHKLKVIRKIEACRTSQLGGHIDMCDNCGYTRISYNSCRNRHCPKCQSLAKEKWLINRKKDLLPIEYFHVVFTIPHLLNLITLQNQEMMYSILFKSVSETLLELARDKKHLGADIGFISILHTWGQNLMDHHHLHCIVTGGGLSFDASRWISCRKGFFIHVKVLSKMYKGKFLFYLKKAYEEGKIKFLGTAELLGKKEVFESLIDNLYKTDWVVYSKPPYKSNSQVFEYISRYTHRVAISNNRIMKMEDNKISFRWKDYSDGSQNKIMTLDVEEFIRRFLLHILPDKFVKIRYYGILSNRNRKTKLKKCMDLLGVKKILEEILDTKQLIKKITGIDITICPKCKAGKMVFKEEIKHGYMKLYYPRTRTG